MTVPAKRRVVPIAGPHPWATAPPGGMTALKGGLALRAGRSMPSVRRQKSAHRDADHMIDTLLSRRRSKVEDQRLEHRGLAGIKELRRRNFSVRDCEITGGHLVFEIAAEPSDAGRRPAS